jgi:hypothetical protein
MLGCTVACVYCNCATNKAFEYVWEGFFKAVEKATGSKIQFKAFNESGNILCVILDMKAAQVQGLGAAIIHLKMNNPLVSKITEVDPNIIVQYLIKLCFMHWVRYGILLDVYSKIDLVFGRRTEKLTSIIGHNVVQYLNKFPALENPADITAWKKFCEEHPSKELHSMFYISDTLNVNSIMRIIDWYTHKTMYL